MDPTACLTNLLDELLESEPDRDRIVELLHALKGWIERGGFLPKMNDHYLLEQAIKITDLTP